MSLHTSQKWNVRQILEDSVAVRPCAILKWSTLVTAEGDGRWLIMLMGYDMIGGMSWQRIAA